MKVAIQKYNEWYYIGSKAIISDCPSLGKNELGVAYAQWSNSFVTGNMSDPATDSVT